MSYRQCAGFLSAWLLILGACPLVASFTIEQVTSTSFASGLVAAPTGSAVAWLLNEQGRRNIYVASGPEFKARRVTDFQQDDGQEIAELAWAQDGSYLLFTRGGDFEMGREHPNPSVMLTKPDQSIWRVSMDGSASKKLTEGHGAAISPKGDWVAYLKEGQIWMMKPSGEGAANTAIQQGKASELMWSPDGTALAFVSARGEHSFIGIYEVSAKSIRYLNPSVDRDVSPVWSPDGSRIAYLRIAASSQAFMFGPKREGQPWSIEVSDCRSGKTQQIFTADVGQGSVFSAVVAERQVFWGANDRLVFPWEKSGWRHLYSVPATGGNAVELTPGEGEVEHVTLQSGASSVFYSANFLDIDRRHIWSVDVSAKTPPKQVTKGEGIEWSPTPIGGRALVFLASSYNRSAHAAVESTSGEIRALATEAVPTSFPADQLVKPQPVMLTASDGLPIHGQLFLPPNAAQGRHPALLFFHGGSRRQMLVGFHYMEYYSNAYEMNQYLASQGYVVLSVNYRSGIGYGLNFREALNYGATGASEFNDVMGAGLYVKSRADVDPKRVGIWGGSYGGYLTALGLARASDLFAAGVDFHGVHDWSEVIANFEPGYDPQKQVAAAKLAFDSSPMASVDTWRSPVLLIHGDDDRNVPFHQTVELVEALRQRKVPFEELIFPNEVHDLLLHQDWVRAYEATAEFFGRRLGKPE